MMHQMVKAKNENDSQKLRSFFSSNFIAHIAGWTETLNLDQYIKAVEASHKSFSQLKFTIEDMIVEDDKVFIWKRIEGKHTGEYQGHFPSQHRVNYYGAIVRRIHNGKVVEEWQLNDNLSLLRQIGLSVNHII